MTAGVLQTTPNSAIPAGFRKKIAQDIAKDATGHAAGIVYVAPDGDVLLLRRSSAEENYAGHWALPGGGVDKGETPRLGAARESKEEMGIDVSPDGMKPLDLRITPNGKAFHTFAQPVAEKFVPKLNGEHSGYAWAPLNQLPGPIHPAVQSTFDEQVGAGADAMTSAEAFANIRDSFTKWAREPEEQLPATDSALLLALDRDTVREIDRDGRMHVTTSRISKACVSPYRGREIPGFEELGLDPDKIYNLLRDPEELRKAAATCNGVQLLQKHIAVNADDHQPYDIVGTTGTSANFDGEYLNNSLHVWAKKAIEGIESNKQRELSGGYHYKPDMTAGNFRGTAFDGIMRDIVFNHVALVEDGRAGPDVLVGDSMENLMARPTRFAHAALHMVSAAVRPLLAMDAKGVDLMPAFKNVKGAGFKAKPVVIALDAALKGKLAKDADLEQVNALLDRLEDAKPTADDEVDEKAEREMETAAKPKPVVKDAVTDPDVDPVFDAEPIRAFLKGKGVGDADIEALCGMLPKSGATDEAETDEEKAAREKKAKEVSDAKDAQMKNMVTKPAMDAAITAAVSAATKGVRETERGIRNALADVRPWVGELPTTLAFDSAADVHRHALTMLGVDSAKTLHADALLPVLQAQKKPGARVELGDNNHLAMDSAAIDEATKLAPGLANIKIGV